MIEISFLAAVIAITVIWAVFRVCIGIGRRKFSLVQEAKLLMVYICIVVIIRCVGFPMHHVDGHIAPLVFDISRMCPPWINLIPIVHLFDVYDGWQINIIGNIALFVPVGIVWPVCFKKIDSVFKSTIAGFGLTLSIEILQLPFFDRCSDIDDIILNTLGVFIGAMIYFGCKALRNKKGDFDNL